MSAKKKNQFQSFYEMLNESQIAHKSEDTHRVSILNEIAREKRLKNDDAEQDINLKKTTLDRLFVFLASETAIIFVFAFLQATHIWQFILEEWSFKLLTSVTITQITVMLFVAVSYLFPKNKS